MLQSYVINIDGAFVGAAVRLDVGYRFIPIDYRLEDLRGSLWPTLADLQRSAKQIFRTDRSTSSRGPSGSLGEGDSTGLRSSGAPFAATHHGVGAHNPQAAETQ